MITLSILDQSPIPAGSNAVEALANTALLVQEAEKLGYKRFWVSEHHNSKRLAGSSPEILMAHLAAKTSHIRIGSGGVMLPHYSAYKVAENFRLLEGLYPGRIDAGFGRAPGGMPIATRALQEGKVYTIDRYPEQLDDFVHYVSGSSSDDYKYAGLQATPVVPTIPEVWLLGSSGESAMIAATRGAAFVFAQFINGEGGSRVVRRYQEVFQPSVLLDKPKSMVAIFVICQETEEEANRVASSLDLSILKLEQGKPSAGTPSVEEAMNYPYTPYDRLRIRENRNRMIVGDKEQVKQRILTLSEEYNTEEFMIVTITHDFEAKLKSYRLLAEAFNL